MQRSLSVLVFCALAGLASAQHPDFYPEDNDEMRANADKHMRMVDDVASLTADQKSKVTDAYMQMERELVAINHRFQYSGYTEEERATEMGAQWRSMEAMLNRKLKEALTGTQMAKWEEASK